MVLRKLAEVMVRGKKIKRHIIVNGRKVPIFVSPDSQLKYLKKSGSWDQDLIDLAVDYVKKGDDVWDIGANVGVFSFAAAAMSQTGKITAFEPDTFLVEVIKSSIKLNGLRNVQVLPVAIASEDGFEEFLIAGRGRASNSLKSVGGRSQMGGIRDSFLVPTLSGTSAQKGLNSNPKVIKIDVEGAELMVLQGLKEILKSVKPIIYVELGFESKQQAANFLETLGYFCEGMKDRDQEFGNYLFKPIIENQVN